MKVCGVVSEFNPFHNGHKYLLSKIKEMGFDAVVCVMSGNFVQRAEYAVCDKKVRARLAMQNGADLVISIPFPWSSASAELFAKGAVSILDNIGIVDAIAFGSESGDIETLKVCAELLANTDNKEIIQIQKQNPSLSYARARQSLVKEKLSEKYADILSEPNDILALEYIKALIKSGSRIEPIALKRVESTHDGRVRGEKIASSSQIRRLVFNKEDDNALRFMPDIEADFFAENLRRVDVDKFFNTVCGAVLSREPQELSEISEIGGGLEYSLYREMLLCKDYESLLSSLSSKHLTDAKIRRALLFTAIGVKKSAFSDVPRFTEVLACGEKGRELLAAARKLSEITVLSKIGNIKGAPQSAKEQFKLQRRAEMIFDKLML